MNIYEFSGEYDNFTVSRRKEYLHKLIDYMVDREDKGDSNMRDLLELFLNDAVAIEEDDGFGTEGFGG